MIGSDFQLKWSLWEAVWKCRRGQEYKLMKLKLKFSIFPVSRQLRSQSLIFFICKTGKVTNMRWINIFGVHRAWLVSASKSSGCNSNISSSRRATPNPCQIADPTNNSIFVFPHFLPIHKNYHADYFCSYFFLGNGMYTLNHLLLYTVIFMDTVYYTSASKST